MESWDAAREMMRCRQRNKFCRGDEVELLMPGREPMALRIDQLFNADGQPVESAPHADELLYVPVPFEVPAYSMIRRKKEEGVK